MVGAVALSMTACGKGKIQQCNALIKEVNASQGVVATLATAIGKPDKIKAAQANIKSSVDKIKAVEIADEKLKGFQGNWADNLGKLSGTLGKRSSNKDPKKALMGVKELSAQGKQFETLIKEINGYCGGKS